MLDLDRPAPDAPTPPSAGALEPLLAALSQAFLADRVVAGEHLRDRQLNDWSGTAGAAPAAMLLPRSTAEVSTMLRLCHAHRCPVAVQGGLTGLAGGATPQAGELVLSLARLDAIEDIDTLGGTALVQAGVTLESLQTAAEQAGWCFPLDLGARGSCQLGGNAATNAGGNRVLRYGMMRNLVRGLEVVLADGSTLTMLDRVIKNNAGFDLKHLFIGSEGTLGVITRLSLALVPLPSASRTVLCATQDFRTAAALLTRAKRELPELSAFELMWQDFFEANLQALGRRTPFTDAHPLYALIETQGTDDAAATSAMERFLESAFEQGEVADAVVAQSLSQAEDLWSLREVSELLPRLNPSCAFDVSVALPRMDALVTVLRARLQTHFPRQQHLFFGHLGDGNLHLMSGPYDSDADHRRAEELVYTEVGAAGGSISAEHGIGMAKRAFLHHSRSPLEIETMRRLKQLFDPLQILNPGRVLPGD